MDHLRAVFAWTVFPVFLGVSPLTLSRIERDNAEAVRLAGDVQGHFGPQA